MERIVTLADLEKYPQLVSQGVSINQNYDFSLLESANETPPIAEQTHEAAKPIPKKKATKVTHKATPAKQKAKRR